MFFIKNTGKSKYASNNMVCVACSSRRVKFKESLGPYVNRWQCKDCGQTWRYVIPNMAPPDPKDILKKPSLLLGGPRVFEQQVAPVLRRIPIVGREARIARKIAAGNTR